MEKMKMQTTDIANENFLKLAALFPNAVTETIDENGEVVRAIDKDILMQEISTRVVEGNEERYQFTWPDKRQAMRLASTPIAATLRPCRDESVNFDTTQNLYIEGDNLDVLKLLRETYLGKVKMIYIDPPYNTGGDFVYNDDFSETIDEYAERSNDYDSQGNRLVQNTESNGRFHTDWLNMIYPRLKVAKDLLTDDGVIFISIDDNEQENLKKICDEIFGSSNFIATAILQRSTNGMGDKKGFARNHEYVLCYQRSNSTCFKGLRPDSEYIKSFDKEDKNGKYKIDGILMKKGAGSRREDSPTLYFPLYYSPVTGHVSLNNDNGYVERYPIKSDGSDGRWTWGREKINNESHRLYASPNGTIYIKDYFTDDRRMKIKTVLIDSSYLTDRATNEVKDIFNSKAFDTPKPITLLIDLLDLVTSKNDTILDFFSGSATTAHAVMKLNAEDGGNRKFVMVQLPEVCADDSEAAKTGYKNICEIGKERIRRAGKKIMNELTTEHTENTENKNKSSVDSVSSVVPDIGFRVLKLDSSNMEDVYYAPDKTSQDDLLSLISNIKPDRTPEDLLFQVMLEFGITLDSKIEETVISGKKVFKVAGNFLIACFDENVTDDVVKAIAQATPAYAVLRDSSFANDSVAANFEQIFATYSPDTVRRVL